MFFVKCYDYKGILEGFFKKLRLCGMIGESMMNLRIFVVQVFIKIKINERYCCIFLRNIIYFVEFIFYLFYNDFIKCFFFFQREKEFIKVLISF